MKHREEGIFQPVLEEQLSLLKHWNLHNPPILVIFSATPGMGKTTVAKYLEEALGGIRISSDDARNLMRKHNLNPAELDQLSKEPLVDKYLSVFLEEVLEGSQNGLILLDKSVDRTYQQVIAFARSKQLPTFFIRLKLPREEVETRIRAREEEPEMFLRHLDRFFKDYYNLMGVPADFTMDMTMSIEDLPLKDLEEAIIERYTLWKLKRKVK